MGKLLVSKVLLRVLKINFYICKRKEIRTIVFFYRLKVVVSKYCMFNLESYSTIEINSN